MSTTTPNTTYDSSTPYRWKGTISVYDPPKKTKKKKRFRHSMNSLFHYKFGS